MTFKFLSLASGSSGNCYYVGNDIHGLLIDAGISASAIRKHLKEADFSLQSVMGVLVTHNHTDHIKGLAGLCKKHALPVFTTQKVWKSINQAGNNIAPGCFNEIAERHSINISGFDVEAFRVNHDAPETLGFHIRYGTESITIVTDLGHICDTASHYIRSAGILVIESNYDETMLETGTYPYFLKKRIVSENGHLGNRQTASFLAGNLGSATSHIFLAHLSKNNNTPEKALECLMEAFAVKRKELNDSCQISVLKRNSPSGLTVTEMS